MCSCQLFVPVSVNTGKHRWRESNPHDAGLESGPQPLHIGDDPEDRAKEKSRLLPVTRLRRLLEISPLGDHPGGPPARGLSSMPSRWYSKVLSVTGRRHADKTMRPRRQAFVRVLAPYTMSPQGLILAGISLTHPARRSQRISYIIYSGGQFLAGPTYAVPRRFPAAVPRRFPAAVPRVIRATAGPRRTPPLRNRFGITHRLPLHSCLGTRRLSSVGRASHS
jgi:hypothetical protein